VAQPREPNGAAFDVYVWAPRVSQPEGGGDAPTQDGQAASWRGPGKKDSESGHANPNSQRPTAPCKARFKGRGACTHAPFAPQ